MGRIDCHVNSMSGLYNASAARSLLQYTISRQTPIISGIVYLNFQSSLFQNLDSLIISGTLYVRYDNTFTVMCIEIQTEFHTYGQTYNDSKHSKYVRSEECRVGKESRSRW